MLWIDATDLPEIRHTHSSLIANYCCTQYLFGNEKTAATNSN